MNITKKTILQINHEGFATLYNRKEECYQSKNTVTDFDMRGNSDHDGVDYWNLSDEEIGRLVVAFDFEFVNPELKEVKVQIMHGTYDEENLQQLELQHVNLIYGEDEDGILHLLRAEEA